jgi:hypothetical protein
MGKPFRWEWIGQSPRLRPIALRNAKGYGTTRLGTYYPPKSGYTAGRFFDEPVNDEHMHAVIAVIEYINNGVNHDDMVIKAESQYGLCGRELEDPVSVDRGIGPECTSKPTGSKILHASKFVIGIQATPGVPAPADGYKGADPLAYDLHIARMQYTGAELELDRLQQKVQDQQIECSRLAEIVRQAEKAAFAAQEAAQEKLVYENEAAAEAAFVAIKQYDADENGDPIPF